MIVIGFGGILYNVTAISLIQAITPDRILGRANASRRFVVWGVVPLGGFTGGALASTIGLRGTMVVGAVGGLLTIVPILFSPLRSVGRMSELEPLDAQYSPIASRAARLRSSQGAVSAQQPRKPVAHRHNPSRRRVDGEARSNRSRAAGSSRSSAIAATRAVSLELRWIRGREQRSAVASPTTSSGRVRVRPARQARPSTDSPRPRFERSAAHAAEASASAPSGALVQSDQLPS